MKNKVLKFDEFLNESIKYFVTVWSSKTEKEVFHQIYNDKKIAMNEAKEKEKDFDVTKNIIEVWKSDKNGNFKEIIGHEDPIYTSDPPVN
jgi:hypothetical protein